VKSFSKGVRASAIGADDRRALKAGDAGAFERIYDELAGPALRYAAILTGQDRLCADAVQEAFLRVYRHRGRLNPQRPFEPWFYRILRNECMRAMRWKNRLTPVETLPEQPAPQADSALHDAIANLSPKLREPLVLRYLLGYADRETAQIMGISPAAVKARVRRAREKLKDELRGEESEHAR
jgi:RNA polymerase sigma factor (sigma-70 family)